MRTIARGDSSLAINGGPKVRHTPWPTYDKGHVIIDEEDADAALRVIRSRLLFRYDKRHYNETEVGRFEEKVKRYFDCKFALAATSGTTAITLGLLGVQIRPGDLVACPAFTFAATPSAILLAGAQPVTVEVDENLHMDVADLRRKYTPSMKAIVVVHMRGFASDMSAILAFANEVGIPVIEDAVPALGVRLDGKLVGTFGAAGAFSSQSDKSINTGEGGFLVTDDPDVAARAIAFSGAYEGRTRRHFGGDETPPIDDLDFPLYSFRMDEIRGAMASTQMDKVPSRIARLRSNYDYLAPKVADIDGIRLRATIAPDANLGDALMVFVRDPSPGKAAWFANALRAEGIDSRAFDDPADPNVRVFWNWRFMYPNMSIGEVQRLLPASTRHLCAAIDIPLSPFLDQSDCDDLVAALEKVSQGAELTADRLERAGV